MSDARETAPSFDELIGLIEKNFKDLLNSYNIFSTKHIEDGWQRYKTLNHLYQDEPAKLTPAQIKERKEAIDWYRNPAGQGAVWVKGKYDRLYEQVKGGKRSICYVDYRWDANTICRDICTIKPEYIALSSRGITYGSLNQWPEDLTEKESFIKMCEFSNVEWLDEFGAIAEPIETAFIPCEDGDPRCCGGFTSNDGQSLCHVREVEVAAGSGKEDACAFVEFLNGFYCVEDKLGAILHWIDKKDEAITYTTSELYDIFKK